MELETSRMPSGRVVLKGLLGIAMIAATVLVGWRIYHDRANESCKACSRAVHAHMRTLAMVDGQRANYCCPACALSDHQQSGKPVEITELTDFQTNAALEPSHAFIVRNSDLNPCLEHRHPAVGEGGQPLEAHFDRCAPSVLSFRDRESANAFARNHGGNVSRFADFAAQFK